jgi:hypothetical protein
MEVMTKAQMSAWAAEMGWSEEEKEEDPEGDWSPGFPSTECRREIKIRSLNRLLEFIRMLEELEEEELKEIFGNSLFSKDWIQEIKRSSQNELLEIERKDRMI